ncbi:Tc toxin subunit A-related protein [Collimonas humicola]|uniref:Tc toxin subunit A-related protein n=1 Tax=Collimonas humicola TaxID=2825886 RepID=UPI001B8D3E2D|nr:neuraminidase-like domain-containing protein [Collimonas humicola]
MSALIAIRLHPDKPTQGVTFISWLAGLVINVYDLNVGDPKTGQLIGSATYVAPPGPPWIPDPSTGIVQHFTTLPLIQPEAVATAVIQINEPAGYKEYVSPDLRIEIVRGATTVIDGTLYYDVQTSPGPLPPAIAFPSMSAALYLQLPHPIGAGLANVDIGSDGAPPNFKALKDAVNLVLAADQGPVPALDALKPEQARHIAYEIVWGPQDPLPDIPAFSPPSTWDAIGAMYTFEANDGALTNPLEQNRQQFEGNLNSYYATHNAKVDSLARYIYALSAAVACEASSTAAASAMLDFPVYPGGPHVGTTISTAQVLLVDGSGGSGPLVPAFTVPAEYFYVLGAQLSIQLNASQRFLMAVRDNQERLLPVLTSALDSGIVNPAPAINPAQAVRRLDALQPASGTVAPSCKLDASVLPLVNDWLAFPSAAAWRNYAPGDDAVKFWTPELTAQPAPYLQLVLCALTLGFQPLMAAIAALPVATVAALAALSATQWENLFSNTALLPPFTAPGTPAARIAAFIRRVQKFFDMDPSLGAMPSAAAGAAPILALPTVDLIGEFVVQYVALTGPFTFGAAALDDTAVDGAVQLVLPGDPAAQAWLNQRVHVINSLCQLAGVASNVMPPAPSLAFSVAEALYARGFTSADDVLPLSLDDFSDALRGTVAFDQAALIYAKAGAVGPQPAPAPQPFQPVNPGGLVNCIPPCYLSPLGPVEYLHELLALSEASTCRDPAAAPPKGKITLGDAVAARRGDLGSLKVSAANAETQLPLIDIVNENLEHLAAIVPATPQGAVYDTASGHLGHHKLCMTAGQGQDHDQDDCHQACQLLEALPEHSAPAVPVAQPVAYDKLKLDFSAPGLPYSEPLDICRSYLEQAGTCRFETMRTFRQEITEFALDPSLAAPAFQSHLWRYPVRIDTAIEYLGINPEEYALLFTQDIAEVPTPGRLLLYELYGFDTPTPGGVAWTAIALQLPEFLKRTGLSYCELVELQKSMCFTFAVEDRSRQSANGALNNADGQRVNPDQAARGRLPDCEPCCLEHYLIHFLKPASQQDALRMLAVFLRLWRKLQQVCGARYSFAQLCDICEVLQLFIGNAINPDFIRQLTAFQILRDQFRLKLSDGSHAAGAHGANRTHILALWVGSGAAKWNWALDQLVEHIQQFAKRHYTHADRSKHRRDPQFIKLLKANFDPLSKLAGFDPGNPTDTWHSKPAATLRFAEVLAKITGSQFGIGEILYLFSADDHLDGDDPFPLQDSNEAQDSPLAYPDDDSHHDLWQLRHKLLEADIGEEDEHKWSWHRIEAALRNEFGYQVAAGDPDYLASLGQHFFPGILEHSGTAVTAAERQYRTPLVAPSAAMWNLPPDGPFRFDGASSELWTQLPLQDQAVIDKLQHLRDLTASEQLAVQNLYHMPRVDLATFACLFPDFSAAEKHLIEEHDEEQRWAWFRRQFALTYRRCHLIAEHLAQHVAAVTGEEWQDAASGLAAAWLILKRLYADGNLALGSWEADSGVTPPVTWTPPPSGGSFAALLGLTGTGLLGEFRRADGPSTPPVWREMRGPMSAFDHEKNRRNAPAPTILPAMDLDLSPAQLKYVVVRNGFAVQDQHGRDLGGAESFGVDWSGILLVDEDGKYTFSAGAPTPDGEQPDLERAQHCHWRVTLSRGQKNWVVLHHRWHDSHHPHERHGQADSALHLKRGAYNIVVEFIQPAADFSKADDLHPQHTGFQVKYCGADTHDRPEALPLRRLFREEADQRLDHAVKFPDNSKYCSAALFLQLRYASSLRDIRRTYQRAFKALLFTHRFGLSGRSSKTYQQSELGYMLDHAALFAGVSFYRNPPPAGAFMRHAADFDFNLLPLKDFYHSPAASQDQRVAPSVQREQAWFDNWERLFDYSCMRHEREKAIERPAWLLFEEALEKQPDNPAQLLRHLDVDALHASLVLNYFQSQATPVRALGTTDLEDDRWSVRVWHGDRWVRQLVRHFTPRHIGAAQPDLWAADDPGQALPGQAASGDANLVRFIDDGYLENHEPRRYADLQRLNDQLRVRARAALLAYLCGMQRVALPWGDHARGAKDLSALLLLDVESGCCERASRIEEAVTAVQNFVQRARLGLEGNWLAGAAFVQLWKHEFASYRTWEKCKCRSLYKENWIDWDELQQARKIEAFQFLEQKLRRSTLTIAEPGGLEYWPETLPPAHPAVKFLQKRDASALRLLQPPREGLGVSGTPERDARPSWLAPDTGAAATLPPTGGGNHNPAGVGVSASASAVTLNDKLPFWIQAAIRLGIKFVRLAAGGIPPAAAEFHASDFHEEPGCCNECGCIHPPLVDEYYFWLAPAQIFNTPPQDAYYDPTQQASPRWHDDQALPTLLDWKSAAATQLAWCRVHNGEFRQPRRSDGLVQLTPGTEPDLAYVGRVGDSLTFAVSNGIVPAGYNGSDAPGFRYDMADDDCLALPLVADPAAVASPYPAGLPAYPYFAYVEPGDRLFPASLFSPALAVAGVLRCHCRFEPALKWYQLVNNPLQVDNSWVHCSGDSDRQPPANVPPVTSLPPGDVAPGIAALETAAPARDATPLAVAEASAADTTPGGAGVRPPAAMCCDSTHISAEVARDRSILLHYLETLVEWSQALLRQNSRESAQQTRLVLDTAATILGPCPRVLLNHAPPPSQTVAVFKPLIPPLNPRLMELYCHVKDGLALVHRCLSDTRLRNADACGSCSAPYFGQAPCRCATLEQHCGCEAMQEAICDDDEWCRPHSPYRYVYLLQKAQEASSRVREQGAALLSAFSNGDAEYLAAMRSRHETQLADLTIKVRQDQWRDAEWQVQALEKTKEVSQTNRRYYKHLIDVGLNNGELNYQSNTNSSLDLRSSAIPIEATGEAMRLIPDLFVGFPCEETWLPLGTKLGEMFQAIARITNEFAEIASVNAGLDLTQASWQRRLDDWVHQVEILDIEIEQEEIQILGAERRRSAALEELNLQQTQLAQSREVLDALRDKFTNHELYLYLQKETAALHWKMFELARYLALEAQRAFNFELGCSGRQFIGNECWDDLHEGLLAGERLQLALQRMDAEYAACNRREYELTKHVSLALHFPLQFLRLKITGSCEIEIPEWMFDMDYPGQYMRRIKNVSLTIPCVTGPYTGVHCRLTLLSSRTRIDPCLPCPVTECCHERPRNHCGCSHAAHEHYALCGDDRRAVRHYGAREAIATSSGRNDAGLFELNFHDERHLPFEFFGAVSCWRIEMPPENNYFDMDSLTDLVLHMNYTAREGGTSLRAAASDSARRKLPGNGWILIDLRKDYPDAWELFQRRPPQHREGGRGAEQARERSMRLPLSRKLFPFLPSDPALRISKLAVLFELEERCDERDDCPQIDACPCAQEDVKDSHLVEVTIDHADDDCDDAAETEINCVTTSEWPKIYHGVAEVDIGPIDQRRKNHTMVLTVGHDVGKLERAFLLCRYETACECCETVQPLGERHDHASC